MRKEPRFVLLFTEQHVTLFFLPASKKASFFCLTRLSIEASPDHLGRFLEEFPRAPIDIFHDTPDQTLKVEKVPQNLYGLDPYRWICHKKKHFEEENFSGARQYRGKNREVLLASLQISPSLFPWLEQLQCFPNPTQGIYAFALEQLYIYHHLHHSLSSRPSKWLLGVNFEEDGRMRHTILHEGRFVLSRLLPPPAPLQMRLSDEENMTREIQGTLRYLMKQFPVNAFEIEGIFCGAGLRPDFLKGSFEGKYWVLSPQEGAALLDMLPAPSHFDTLFLAWFYKNGRRPFLLFKPASKKHKGIRLPLQKGGWIFAWAVGFGLWTLSGVFFLQRQQLEKEMASLVAKEALLKKEESRLHLLLASFPLSADQLRQIIAIQDDLGASSEAPLDVLDRLKNVLGENLRLRRLDWQGESLEGFSNVLTLEAYPTSSTLSQKELVFLFDGFLSKLKEEFSQSTLEVLHGPYSTHQTQLLTGGFEDEALSPDPVCVVKIKW